MLRAPVAILAGAMVCLLLAANPVGAVHNKNVPKVFPKGARRRRCAVA